MIFLNIYVKQCRTDDLNQSWKGLLIDAHYKNRKWALISCEINTHLI